MSNLVHITKIEMVDVSQLANMRIVNNDTCCFSTTPTFTSIKIKGLVGVEVRDEFNGLQTMYTTTLKFKVCSKDTVSWRRKAFRLTSVNGTKYMVGTKSRPFAIVKASNPWPENEPDNTFQQVTVEWKSTHPMLQVLVL